jgi:serine/threonine-protein kinase
VRTDGTVKLIDLGFGKRIDHSLDFDKSITLNWWCETPAEFAQSRYDFGSEVYFVGKLFEKLIADFDLSHFKYLATLGRMCKRDPATRTASFAAIDREIRSNQTEDIEFTSDELNVYREFADALCGQVSKIERRAKYVEDAGRIVRQLEDAYRKFILEAHVPDMALILRCMIDGAYYYRGDEYVETRCVRDFIQLLKSATDEKRRLIVANIHTRFDCVPRYRLTPPPADDIPF